MFDDGYVENPAVVSLSVLFFQAEDGIRDATVTGVQTCALPILGPLLRRFHQAGHPAGSAHRSARNAVLYRKHVPVRVHERNLHRAPWLLEPNQEDRQIGRASCRERVKIWEGTETM